MAYTSQTTSDDIKTGINLHGSDGAYDTTVIITNVFYDGAEKCIALFEIPGGGFRSISPANGIGDYSFNDLSLIRAWSKREMVNWLDGTMQAVTYTFEDAMVGRKCTLEIGAGSWEGTDLTGDDTEALGLAFIELLNDVDFNDYVA